MRVLILGGVAAGTKAAATLRREDPSCQVTVLTKGKDQASLQKIAERAAKGDTAQLKSLIQSITSTPGGAGLLQRLGKNFK